MTEENEATIHTIFPVANWNLMCGKKPHKIGSDEFWESLENQAERIMEELKETIDKGIKKRCLKELLDGCVDLDVTVSGLSFLSRQDVLGATEAILDNNNLKYTIDEEKIEAELEYYNDKFGEGTHKIVSVTAQTELQGNMFDVEVFTIHRISDDKICKFSDHPEVILDEFIITE